jgi:hypothetical protein
MFFSFIKDMKNLGAPDTGQTERHRLAIGRGMVYFCRKTTPESEMAVLVNK